jgi:Holliday junction resolvasome RuvABC endonuclease subunit
LKKTSLGIDCSARSTGIVSLTASHKYSFTLITPKKLLEGSRLEFIYDAVDEFTRGKKIDLAIMETPSYNSTNKPFTLGEIHGVIKLVLRKRGIPLVGIAPKSLKKYATGKGTASKQEVCTVAQNNGCPEPQFDVTDAWVAAMAGLDVLLDRCSTGLRPSYEVVHLLQEKYKCLS